MSSIFGKMSTAILRYTSGRFGLVGSIPYELTEPDPHGTPQIPPNRKSLVWDTEQDVIEALLAIGCARFQRADCSWYQPDPIMAFALALDAAPKVVECPFALTASVAKANARVRQFQLFEEV